MADIARSVHVSFLVFVLALGVVVRAVMLNGMDRAMSAVLPSGSALPALLAIAAVAAVLANIVNNLPATLVLLPLVAPSGPVAILAVLLGVNIGPNLTYVGSLSNLLWRRVLRQHDVDAGVGNTPASGCARCPCHWWSRWSRCGRRRAYSAPNRGGRAAAAPSRVRPSRGATGSGSR